MNWLQATRAAAHAGVAAVITFSRTHSSEFGLNMLILFAGLYVAASAATPYLDNRYKLTSARLSVPLISPVVVAIAASLAISAPWSQEISLRWLTAIFAAGFAGTEWWLSRKLGTKTVDGRDALISSFLGFALLGLFAGFDMGRVPFIGFLGAFHAILAVHLGIAAATPKPKK